MPCRSGSPQGVFGAAAVAEGACARAAAGQMDTEMTAAAAARPAIAPENLSHMMVSICFAVRCSGRTPANSRDGSDFRHPPIARRCLLKGPPGCLDPPGCAADAMEALTKISAGKPPNSGTKRRSFYSSQPELPGRPNIPQTNQPCRTIEDFGEGVSDSSDRVVACVTRPKAASGFSGNDPVRRRSLAEGLSSQGNSQRWDKSLT
jgi:hypothetical protein